MTRRRILGGGGGSDDYNSDGDDGTDDSDLDEPGWRITHKMIDRVDSSDWLRLELGDGGLRRMIFGIDESDHRGGEGRRKRTEDAGIWRDRYR